MTYLKRPGAFIASEIAGLSRDGAIIAALNDASTILGVGRVLGAVTTPAVTAAAIVGTGNATIGTLSATGTSPLAGAYRATCTDATHFTVTDPNGAAVSTAGGGVFGTAFDNGQIKFTITAGSTPCIAGDYFVITVAANSGKYKLLAPTATDGTQKFAGIAFDSYDVSGATDVKGAVIARNAEVKDVMLDWGTLRPDQIATAKTQMAAVGIVVRSTQ